jgi:hypothetical protein
MDCLSRLNGGGGNTIHVMDSLRLEKHGKIISAAAADGTFSHNVV